MSTKKFKTQYNHKPSKEDLEHNFGPSLTVPDQSLSVSELLRRHRAGLPIDGKKMTFYDDEGNQETMEFPDVRKMDISEIQEMIEKNREYIKELQESVETANLLIREKEQYEKLKAKYKEQEIPFEEVKKDEKPKNNDSKS